jgi:hypothetical protein
MYKYINKDDRSMVIVAVAVAVVVVVVVVGWASPRTYETEVSIGWSFVGAPPFVYSKSGVPSRVRTLKLQNLVSRVWGRLEAAIVSQKNLSWKLQNSKFRKVAFGRYLSIINRT